MVKVRHVFNIVETRISLGYAELGLRNCFRTRITDKMYRDT